MRNFGMDSLRGGCRRLKLNGALNEHYVRSALFLSEVLYFQIRCSSGRFSFALMKETNCIVVCLFSALAE